MYKITFKKKGPDKEPLFIIVLYCRFKQRVVRCYGPAS